MTKKAGTKKAKNQEPVSTEEVAPSAVAEVEVLDSDPFVETERLVEKLSKDEANPVAKSLMDGIEINFFKLGGTLHKINTEGWFEAYGYSTFKDWVETELNLKYRKAMYLAEIYERLVQAGIPYDKVKTVGWTKLKEIAPVLDSDNVDTWVKKAENMSTLQLQQEVKLAASDDAPEGGGDAPEQSDKKVSTKTFKLYEDQRETIEDALDKAKKSLDTEFDSVALEAICMDFLSGSGKPKKSGGDIKKQIRDMGYSTAIDLLEEVFKPEGLSITAEIDDSEDDDSEDDAEEG